MHCFHCYQQFWLKRSFLMISRQLVPLVEVFLKFLCYFVMWCHHVLGRHWSFPFSGFWKVGTLQMETLRFYTAGNQNILIRIPYNSLGCGACCMKLKKLTQESNAVFQKQGYYFSSKQLLWEGFIGLITKFLQVWCYTIKREPKT